jgi:hypothetical protein
MSFNINARVEDKLSVGTCLTVDGTLNVSGSVVLPVLTVVERNAITAIPGTIIFVTNDVPANNLQVYDGTNWKYITSTTVP